ncbi:ATP-binding protein [Pelistega sp. MC2]|uniref:ATP-binding protein n=1 Tax=Pelistega sp. MC2 TaxID=1720297 RepID=UPI0008DAE89B|nr:ATP-binding protein [Pelistega sp. MC2]
MYIARHIQPLLETLVSQFPAILITGARQVGKSTLLQHITPSYPYFTFDNPLLLQQANDDPLLLLQNFGQQAIIDEVQYAPEIFSLLKLEIDKTQRNGLYLLSGSQAFELMKNVHETLAGRIALLTLHGLSLREIFDVPFYHSFIPHDDYLQQREQHLKPYTNLWELIHKGDMPRLHTQETHWEIYYSSYVSTYIERDVRTTLQINQPSDFAKFMVAIASRSGDLLNYSNIANEVGVSADTIKRWVSVLEASGIIFLLYPYSNNHLKRAIKTPKVYMLNTGLMAYLTRWLTTETIQNGAQSGRFFETFVVAEIIKSFTNQGRRPPLYFYRDTNQNEIDLIIEEAQTLYPIEIKTSASPHKKMAKSFAILQSIPDKTIAKGILISQYPQKLYLDKNLITLPIEYI